MWFSSGRSRFGCSKTNGMPSTPSQKSIEVCRSAPTSVMWWTPWLWSFRIGPLDLVWTVDTLPLGRSLGAAGGAPRLPHRLPVEREQDRGEDQQHRLVQRPRDRQQAEYDEPS